MPGPADLTCQSADALGGDRLTVSLLQIPHIFFFVAVVVCECICVVHNPCLHMKDQKVEKVEKQNKNVADFTGAIGIYMHLRCYCFSGLSTMQSTLQHKSVFTYLHTDSKVASLQRGNLLIRNSNTHSHPSGTAVGAVPLPVK